MNATGTLGSINSFADGIVGIVPDGLEKWLTIAGLAVIAYVVIKRFGGG